MNARGTSVLAVPPTLALPPVPEPSTSTAATTASASTAQRNFFVVLRDWLRRCATLRSRRPAVGRPLGGVVADMTSTVRDGRRTMSGTWNRADVEGVPRL